MIHLKSVAPRGASVPGGTRLYDLGADQVRRRRHKLVEVPAEAEGKSPPPLEEVAIAGEGNSFKAGLVVGFDEDAIATLGAADWSPVEDKTQRTLAEHKAEARSKERKAGGKKKPAAKS